MGLPSYSQTCLLSCCSGVETFPPPPRSNKLIEVSNMKVRGIESVTTWLVVRHADHLDNETVLALFKIHSNNLLFLKNSYKMSLKLF